MENQEQLEQQVEQQLNQQQIYQQQAEQQLNQQQIYQQQVDNQQLNSKNSNKKNSKSILLLILLLVLVTITIGYAALSTSFNIVGTSTITGEWCVGIKCGNSCDNVATCQNSPITCPNNDCIVTDCDATPNLCNCNSNTGECSGPTAIDCSQNPDKSDSTKCTCDANGVCKPKAQVWLKGDSVYFRNTLTSPGDVFTFDTTYTNSGNIDAKLGSFTKSSLNATAQEFLTYDVKYDDGSAIVQDESLNAGDSSTFRVTVTYKNVDTLPTQAQLDLINEVASGRNGATSEFTVNYVQKQ